MPVSTWLSNFQLKNTVSNHRMVGLWHLMSGFRVIYIASIVCLGIAAILEMETSFLLRYLVDDVLQRNDSVGLLPLVASGFVGLALFGGIFTFLSNKLAAKTGESITLRMRTYLFDHIQCLTFTYHDHAQTGDLIQRVTSDVDALRQFFVNQSTSLGHIVLHFTINFVALISLNTRLALVMLAGVPLVIGVTYFFQQKISRLHQGFREQEAKLSTILQESLTGVRVVKAFARQAYEEAKFEHDNWGQFLKWRRMTVMRWIYFSVPISFVWLWH